MEYNKNGEPTEVYYYKKLVVNEPEAEKESEQSETVEFHMPCLALKDNKPYKYRKPKVPPKVSVTSIVLLITFLPHLHTLLTILL